MPKVVDHARRRREIVWALWAVIDRCGIDGVTFRAVAAEAGVSVGRIQHYFESKQDLVRYGAEALVSEAERLYRDDAETGDARTALVTLLTHSVPDRDTSVAGVAVWYAYLARITGDPWIRAFLTDTAQRTIDEATTLLHRHGLADGAARDAARRLVAVRDGATQAVFVGAMPPDDAVALVVTEIDRALAGS